MIVTTAKILSELDAAHLSTGYAGATTYSVAAATIRKLEQENLLLRAELAASVEPLTVTDKED